MPFAQVLQAACLASARALGGDVKKVSWLLSNQRPEEHAQRERRAA